MKDEWLGKCNHEQAPTMLMTSLEFISLFELRHSYFTTL